jgi:hypothetical protein
MLAADGASVGDAKRTTLRQLPQCSQLASRICRRSHTWHRIISKHAGDKRDEHQLVRGGAAQDKVIASSICLARRQRSKILANSTQRTGHLIQSQILTQLQRLLAPGRDGSLFFGTWRGLGFAVLQCVGLSWFVTF